MAKFHQTCDLLFLKNECLHSHMIINRVPKNLFIPQYHVFSSCPNNVSQNMHQTHFRNSDPFRYIITLCKCPHGPSKGVLIATESATSQPRSTTSLVNSYITTMMKPQGLSPHWYPSPHWGMWVSQLPHNALTTTTTITSCHQQCHHQQWCHIISSHHQLNATSMKKREQGSEAVRGTSPLLLLPFFSSLVLSFYTQSTPYFIFFLV